MKNILFIFTLLLSLNAYSQNYAKTPGINAAPGELCTRSNKDFDEYRYAENIAHCRRSVSTSRKDKVCARDNVSRDERRKNYTVDHIIPLSLGGSNSEKNLWCQYRGIYTGYIEFEYYLDVREGRMKQIEAVLELLFHKHNPVGKDHVPQPKGRYSPDRTQEQWEYRH